MDLASRWLLMTVFAFMLLALAGLAWSIAAGQWRGLAAGARMVLDDDDESAPVPADPAPTGGPHTCP